MMTIPSTDVSAIPRIDHDEAMVLTAAEFDRTVALLRALSTSDWVKPTDCDRWNVRAVALHLVGAAEANASLPEQVRQMRRGSKLKASIGSQHWWDGANEYQIAKHATLADNRIADTYAVIAPKATAARARMPHLIRVLPVLNLPAPVGRKPLGYLSDMGFTRDVWMHRVDIARATGHTMELTSEHDGRLIADVVAEWATTHGVPFRLELDGPAGGTFTAGVDGENVRIDAVEFCRVLSGRAPGVGVLANPLPL
jgi:uncharacterized protein (TIGR03083 family)